MEVTKVVVIHVGAGIERAQRAVQRQGRLGVALLDALADLHLHEVAAGNQFLGALDGGDVISFGKLTLGRETLRGLDHRCTDRVLQLLFEPSQPFLGVGKSLGQGRVGVDNQIQLARQVVDDGQLLALQEQDVGAAQGVGRARGLELFLNMAHGVVAEVAGQPAAKTRQAWAQRHLETLLVSLNEVQRVQGRSLQHLAVSHHLGDGIGAKAA